MNGRIIIPIMIAVALGIVGLFTAGDLNRLWHERQFAKTIYAGRIESLRYDRLNRGAATVFMNGKWVTFGLDEMKLSRKIMVGDSLVKVRNSHIIDCYRSDSLGIVTLIRFE